MAEWQKVLDVNLRSTTEQAGKKLAILLQEAWDKRHLPKGIRGKKRIYKWDHDALWYVDIPVGLETELKS
jgi:hypothetical protein